VLITEPLPNQRPTTYRAAGLAAAAAANKLHWAGVLAVKIVIPTSVSAGRLRENVDVLDFRLDGDDMSKIAGMDRADDRTGPDPLTIGEY
jgi:diketogulonate reductase-like aldo/keto reductase